MTRVLIGDVGAILRLGLRELFGSKADIRVREAANMDLIGTLQTSLPEVVLIDLDQLGSANIAETIVTQYPAVRVLACSSLRAVMRVYPPFHRGECFSTSLDPDSLLEAVTG